MSDFKQGNSFLCLKTFTMIFPSLQTRRVSGKEEVRLARMDWGSESFVSSSTDSLMWIPIL